MSELRPVRSEASPMRAVWLAAVLVVAGLLAWQLADVLLLAFGAVVFAIALRGLASLVVRVLPMPMRLAVMLALVLIIGVVLAGVLIFRTSVANDLRDLARELPRGAAVLADTYQIDRAQLQSTLEEQFGALASSLVRGAASFGASVVKALAAVFIALVAGLFIALTPHDYADGALRLLPPERRGEVERFWRRVETGIRYWLVAQAASMLFVGLLAGVGLWLVGVPSAAALGLISALGELVPAIGSWIGAVPALLVALGQDGATLLGAASVMLIVQQLESNVITPLLIREMTRIPPALLLIAVVAFGSLFGIAGVVLAAPLLIVAGAGLAIWWPWRSEAT